MLWEEEAFNTNEKDFHFVWQFPFQNVLFIEKRRRKTTKQPVQIPVIKSYVSIAIVELFIGVGCRQVFLLTQLLLFLSILFSGTMADDLMDFSEFDGDENDENADPDVEHAPTLMQTPVVKNSILKQSTKDNLIQLFTPVNKSRKLKVSTGEKQNHVFGKTILYSHRKWLKA